VLAASVATAVDLGDEEGGAPPAKRFNSSLLEEAVYAIGALASDPRANAHYMELNNEGVARRATPCVSSQEYSCVVCAWIEFVKISHTYELLSRHVLSLLGVVVQLLPQSPHQRACTPKVSFHPFSQSSSMSPPNPPSILASSASYP
jgi:hypothetical protein